MGDEMSNISRRALLGGTTAVAASMGFPRLNHDFLFNSAYAATASRPMVFLAAEALTGNWDPTTHTRSARF